MQKVIALQCSLVYHLIDFPHRLIRSVYLRNRNGSVQCNDW